MNLKRLRIPVIHDDKSVIADETTDPHLRKVAEDSLAKLRE